MITLQYNINRYKIRDKSWSLIKNDKQKYDVNFLQLVTEF